MTPTRLPPLAHSGPERIVAWRADGAVPASRFLSDVARLAGQMPAGSAVLNVCQDRYRFLVGFAASVVAGKVKIGRASCRERVS
jgi:hypothetical protein